MEIGLWIGLGQLRGKGRVIWGKLSTFIPRLTEAPYLMLILF